MTSEAPIACSLDLQERPARLAAIAALGRDALLGVDADGTLRFRNDAVIRARLDTIVAAESVCCAFLDFDLSESGAELRLAITAPEGAETAARELGAAFAG